MFSYIKGSLEEVSGDRIVVEAGNIGYDIAIPLSAAERLPHTGSEIKVYTYLQVREDGLSLFGFLSRYDLEMFRQLIGVNGIGPKAALGILSSLSPDSLRMAIIAGDAKAIAKAPGVGVKTAQRIILDLKDKISPEDILEEVLAEPQDLEIGQEKEAVREAIEALVALGYSSSESAKAVKRVEATPDMTAEEVLKASLKFLVF